MSSSVLLCPSAMATLPLITGLAGILGGSSVSPAAQKEKQYDKNSWSSELRSRQQGRNLSLEEAVEGQVSYYLHSAGSKQRAKKSKIK